MKHKFIWRANPHGKKLCATLSGIIKSELANLSIGVSNAIEGIQKYLLMGKSINLAEIGAFRISFGCEGVDNKAGFDAGKIDGLKVIFSPPGTELKKQFM